MAVIALSLGSTPCRATLANLAYDRSGNLTLLGSAPATAPFISGNPLNRVSSLGRAVAFSVTASGAVPLAFQWFFNSAALPAGTNDSYVIPAVGPADFGSYYVVVANAAGSVTSLVAQLQLDSDGDGLPDSWEIANFGSLTNQNAVTDFDGDGNSNLTEFRDGTSPTNKNALLPRLTVRTIGGDVLLAPNNDHYNLGDSVSLTAAPYPGLTFLCWGGDVSGASLNTNLLMNGDKFVQATFGLPLNEVLGVTNVFTTGGDGGWLGQTNDSHDGVSAARSAPIIKHSSSGSVSWMQTTARLTKDGTVDRKSTRLNSSHPSISYAVFCLKKKKYQTTMHYSYSSYPTEPRRVLYGVNP